MLEKLRKYDTINQFEAAMLLANTTDTKSPQFVEALKQIDRAIDAGTLKSTQAIENASARGLKDKALSLQLRKMFIPIQLREDEKQTIIKMKDFTSWQDEKNVCTSIETPQLPKQIDKTVADRLNIMIAAYEAHWNKVEEGGVYPLNKVISAWIMDNYNIKSTPAEDMARFIRPDWAK